MSDRYESLERLQRLREAKTLTEEEFLVEKARLLRDSSDSDTTQERDGGAGYKSLLIGGGLVIAGAIGLGVWAVIPVGQFSSQPTELPNKSISAPPVAEPIKAIGVSALTETEKLKLAFRTAIGVDGTKVTKTADETRITTPIKLVRLPFGLALLTKMEIKDGCHACTGYIGVYYLAEDGEGYRITGSWPEAVSGWGWGAAPIDWNLAEKFSSYPSIFAEGGYTGQGITCGSASVTELRPEGPVASELIRTSYSDAGAIGDDGLVYGEPPRELEGKIGTVLKNKSFEVRVTGTESFVERYVRKGNKFVPVSESKLSC
jgi:hypothetical protein